MIESLVVSRAVSERLKAAGFPHETEFAWVVHSRKDWWKVEPLDKDACGTWFAAPTLSEVLGELPPESRVCKYYPSCEFRWAAWFRNHGEVDDNSANAAALLWLWLKENKEK